MQRIKETIVTHRTKQSNEINKSRRANDQVEFLLSI
jgi:hypothetical protein